MKAKRIKRPIAFTLALFDAELASLRRVQEADKAGNGCDNADWLVRDAICWQILRRAKEAKALLKAAGK